MTDEKEKKTAAWAKNTAGALIQSYIGPDHRVQSMEKLFTAIAQELHEAYERGREEGMVLGTP
jgi:hypothetical protein